MANGLMYPTGVSAQPIDVTSGAQAFMQSAVEARLNEIATSQEQISENKKNVLKALSIKALPELARAQRDRYQTEIEDYRKEVVNKFRDSGGKLTMKQQTEIQDGFVDMQNRMAGEVNDLKRFQSGVQQLKKPNSWQLYDLDRAEQVAGAGWKRLMEGKPLGDFDAEMAQTFKTPSAGEYIAKIYGEDIKSLNIETVGDFKGNIFTTTQYQGTDVMSPESRAKAERYRDNMLQDPQFRNQYIAPDGSIDQQRYEEQKQIVEDRISRIIQESKAYRQSTRGSSVTDKPPVIELAETRQEFPSGVATDSYVAIPEGSAQSPIFLTAMGMRNEETGRDDTFDSATTLRMIGFDVVNDRAYYIAEGGELKKGGEVLYGIEGEVSNEDDISKRKKDGKTIQELEVDTEYALTKLGKMSKFGDSDNATRVTGISVTPNGDGTYTMTGTVEKWQKKTELGRLWSPGAIKEADLDTKSHKLRDSEEVSVLINPLHDEKGTTRYSTSLRDRPEVIGELGKRGYGVGGKNMWQYAKGRKAPVDEVVRSVNGKMGIFDKNTKKFIRWQ